MKKNTLRLTSIMLMMLVFIFIGNIDTKASCVICDLDSSNDAYCRGNKIKACIDEYEWLGVKCKSGITSTKECPSIAS